jgi:hypothetical protein
MLIIVWEKSKNSYLISISKILHKIADDVILFCKDDLNQNLPRDDYKEFLELVIIFFGWSTT